MKALAEIYTMHSFAARDDAGGADRDVRLLVVDDSERRRREEEHHEPHLGAVFDVKCGARDGAVPLFRTRFILHQRFFELG